MQLSPPGTRARLGRQAAAGQLPWDVLELVEHELYVEDYLYDAPSDSSSDSSDGEEEETFACWDYNSDAEGPCDLARNEY